MEYVNAQLNESYCMGKKDEMMSRGYEWSEQGSTATTDPNGLIRSDGKQLSSEIEPTVVNCEPYLTAEHLLALTQLKNVIDASINKNIDHGPLCDPLCESGPTVV
jgi:hypothetical protein